ncbi:PleD family two-component system response regulator [Paraburkholderia sp. DHOC27]|uniref:response regulator n=1 Tax=Paraburkholderia sp. DHOC27 TaxID=2303330 RepID=UPI000E3C4F3B|nr:response regulator [Paraburkholderia sp. DHOC27]RFU46950.1 response regulator [Paraburkholderia sp. DHOC27]
MHSILLVDDDPELLAAWQFVLVNEGYQVRSAPNGVQALEDLKHHIPDLIITDWMMPLMGGAELCRQLRAHPELARVPILVHSAAVPAAEEVQMWNVRLQKPARMNLFLTTVEQLCKGKAP